MSTSVRVNYLATELAKGDCFRSVRVEAARALRKADATEAELRAELRSTEDALDESMQAHAAEILTNGEVIASLRAKVAAGEECAAGLQSIVDGNHGGFTAKKWASITLAAARAAGLGGGKP